MRNKYDCVLVPGAKQHDRSIGGGLGAFFGVNPWQFRLLFLRRLLPGGLPGVLPSIIMWIVIPPR